MACKGRDVRDVREEGKEGRLNAHKHKQKGGRKGMRRRDGFLKEAFVGGGIRKSKSCVAESAPFLCQKTPSRA